MSQTLEDFVAGINWPDDRLASQFITECDLFWGTEEGRIQILSWKSLIGKPSQFLQRQLWIVSDLIEHQQRLAEWQLLDEAEKTTEEIDQETSRLSPVYGDKAKIKEAATAWHNAVQERKSNLAVCRKWVDSEIEKIRKVYMELDKEWSSHVTNTREELRRLRGY